MQSRGPRFWQGGPAPCGPPNRGGPDPLWPPDATRAGGPRFWQGGPASLAPPHATGLTQHKNRTCQDNCG